MGWYHAQCTSKNRLDGKTALITGCNTGIGKETVRDFYIRGARVIMACRNLEKAQEAKVDVEKSCFNLENTGSILITQLDLMSLKSVKDCAEHINTTEKYIHLLICNAGVMFHPHGKTEDGFEIHLATNHLGHFLLTLLLLPKICQSAPARIVNVASMAHILHLGSSINFEDINFERRFYTSIAAYSQSKLANILFMKELDRRLKEANINNVNVYSLHPGVIRTELGRHLDTFILKPMKWIWENSFIFKSAVQGAQTTIYCAVDDKCAKESGFYYSECSKTTPTKAARNMITAKKLWEVSLLMVGLGEHYNPFSQNL